MSSKTFLQRQKVMIDRKKQKHRFKINSLITLLKSKTTSENFNISYVYRLLLRVEIF